MIGPKGKIAEFYYLSRQISPPVLTIMAATAMPAANIT